nr:MAG TPA: type II restriction endonuclease [Caudoviricetes sp.]
MPSKYNDRTYRRQRARLRAEVARRGLVCWICLRPIDVSLPANDPMSFTADHVQALATGGSLHGKLMPAHRGCNSRRGKGEYYVHHELPHRPKTSRQW